MSETFAIKFPCASIGDGKSVLMSTCRYCSGNNIHVLKRHGAFTYVTHVGTLKDNGKEYAEVQELRQLSYTQYTDRVLCPNCGKYYPI